MTLTIVDNEDAFEVEDHKTAIYIDDKLVAEFKPWHTTEDILKLVTPGIQIEYITLDNEDRIRQNFKFPENANNIFPEEEINTRIEKDNDIQN